MNVCLGIVIKLIATNKIGERSLLKKYVSSMVVYFKKMSSNVPGQPAFDEVQITL